MMNPFSARHWDLSMPHFCAAASISISRADAPAWRSGLHDVRMLMLPNTPCIGRTNGVDAREFGMDLFPVAFEFFGEQHRKRSHCSLPHFRLGINKVTVSSGAMWMYAFSFASLPLVSAERPSGSAKATNNPPAACKNPRRLSVGEIIRPPPSPARQYYERDIRRRDESLCGSPDRCRSGIYCCASLHRYRRPTDSAS